MNKSQTFVVFGANTDVGKTQFSVALAHQAKRLKKAFAYVKPLQTGAIKNEDSDAFRVQQHAHPSSRIQTLFSWKNPVSPHLASQFEHKNVDSASTLVAIEEFLNQSLPNELVLVETAGGPASPTADKKLQADVYRFLNVPAILVGDSRLGGISATITAFNFLKSYGYKIAAVVFFESELKNNEFFSEYVTHLQSPVFVLPQLMSPECGDDWLESSEPVMNLFFDYLGDYKSQSEVLPTRSIDFAKKHFWWPFTQHRGLGDINYIDAASGDFFCTQNQKLFDANGSWWTMGIGHGDARLSQAAAYAAGRYGHVLFPQNVHAPAVNLTKKMLEIVGKNWANRVFFSDNGSTAIEVALKMAFRYRETQTAHRCEWKVVGLENSYHGDTIAAMDATNPNGFKQSERWYRPRGVWLKPPTLSYRNGQLMLENRQENCPNVVFEGLADVFSPTRETSELREHYFNYISSNLDLEKENLGALLIEPIIHGSGGMVFIDPLFQMTLIDWCRSHKISVIFDEVFVGLWRLGVSSTTELLRRTPDIACYAKLLTGGILPLAITMASEDVFASFLGDSKAQALLHGHSYTAHPIGCEVASESLDIYLSSIRACRTSDYWSEDEVIALSCRKFVERVVAIGTILAIEFKTNDQGYFSSKLTSFVEEAKKNGFYFRPLGNIIYFVVSPLKTKEACQALLADFYSLCEKVVWD